MRRDTSSPSSEAAPSDLVPTLLVALAAFVVYWLTLLPDAGGPEDTPKFQYLGAVLGTAHQPGYPLHAMLSFAFSKLPVGTVAFRANLGGTDCGVCQLTGGWQVCEWTVPPDAARPGASEVVVRASTVRRPSDDPGGRDARLLGVALRSLDVRWSN